MWNLLRSRFNKIARQFSSLLSKNTWKFINSSMTVAPGEIKLENKLDVIRHVLQEKTARSTDSMNDVICFYTLNTRFESSASITEKGNAFCSK